MADQDQEWLSRRQHPRIAKRFVVKFRPKGAQDAQWEISTLNNVSEGGCSFFSDVAYALGQNLELGIQFPIFKEYMNFLGAVRRCDPDKNRVPVRYLMGVQFTEIEEAKKKEFIDNLNFFVKKMP
jgi:c-di-GMP-binding flagellar brake protein YcgR